MNKAGIVDYQAFAKEVLAAIPDRPTRSCIRCRTRPATAWAFT
jgi:hypothetical protein